MLKFRSIYDDEVDIVCGFFLRMLEELEDKDFFLLPTAKNIAIIRSLIYGNSNTCYVILSDEMIIGASVYIEPPFDTKKKSISAFGSYIMPPFRGHGFYTKLIEFCNKDLKRIGFEEITGQVVEKGHHDSFKDKFGLTEKVILCKEL